MYPATQEAEIRRTAVEGQPGQEPLSTTKPGMVSCLRYQLCGRPVGGLLSNLAVGKNTTPY
jgi:hypothetical protein